MMTVQQMLSLAVQEQRAGRLSEAAALYRQILSQQPDHPDALHLLGYATFQSGRPQEALELIRRAIESGGQREDYLCNLAVVLESLGRHAEAADAYRQAVRLVPQFPEALFGLANCMTAMGDTDGAIAAYRETLALKGDWPEAHNNFGIALMSRGDLQDAADAFDRAAALRPNFPEALLNLGIARRKQGRLDDAVAAYRQALAQRPDYAEALLALAQALREAGGNDEAIDLYHQYIARRPDDPLGYYHIGEALRESRQWTEATAALRKALSLRPDWPEAFFGLGCALQSQKRLDQAAEALRQATRLRWDFVDAQNLLGNLMKDTGQLRQAIACYQSALAAQPHHAQVHSNLLMTLLYCPDQDAGEILRQQCLWDQQHAQPLRACIQPHANDPNPRRPLRIGYVSPDFRDHVVGRNLLPLFAQHDHRQFQIFCYSNIPGADAFTQHFVACADFWREITALDDAQAAELVRKDQIDILVDLAGHTACHRLLLFARKPAPVQVTFGGYPGGTGLATMDYRLTDPRLDPPESDAHYVERSLRVLESFWCYDAQAMGLDALPGPLPALSRGFLTFGCLNNFCKINDPVLALWKQVLEATPHSRLMLLAPEGSHRQRTIEKLGVARERVAFVPPRRRSDYLKTYHRIDLGLDTFPYNGHTTSLDALAMGVPVVTLVGDRAVGRAGWSQLFNLGLQELAAHTPEQWVRLVTDLACDLPRLAQLRSTLRQQMEKSPLMDAPRFARNVESAYRQMWRQWCQPRSP